MTPKELKKNILEDFEERAIDFVKDFSSCVESEERADTMYGFLEDFKEYLSRYHDAIMEEVRGRVERMVAAGTDVQQWIRYKDVLALLQPSEKKEEKIHKSDCCNAEVEIKGDSFKEGTNHWECKKCGKSCNDTFYSVDESETSNW